MFVLRFLSFHFNFFLKKLDSNLTSNNGSNISMNEVLHFVCLTIQYSLQEHKLAYIHDVVYKIISKYILIYIYETGAVYSSVWLISSIYYCCCNTQGVASDAMHCKIWFASINTFSVHWCSNCQDQRVSKHQVAIKLKVFVRVLHLLYYRIAAEAKLLILITYCSDWKNPENENLIIVGRFTNKNTCLIASW